MCAVDAIHMIYALPIECSRNVAVYQWADKGEHTNDERENEREKKMNLVFIMANLSLQSIVTVTSKRNETKRRDTIFYVFMRWLSSSLAFTLTHQKVCWKASSFANARSQYRTFKILMHTRMQITKLIYVQEKCNHYFVSVCVHFTTNEFLSCRVRFHLTLSIIFRWCSIFFAFCTVCLLPFFVLLLCSCFCALSSETAATIRGKEVQHTKNVKVYG